jgi:hypothetical protein
MPLVGFKLTIPAFERAKTVHALDHCDRLQFIYLFMIYVTTLTVPTTQRRIIG